MKAQVICYPAPPPEVVVTMTVEEARALLDYPSPHSITLAALLKALKVAVL